MPERKRIFIVDDHAVLREGLGGLINQSEDLMVCGESASAEEALERIPAAHPDLAIVDLSLPGIGGLELLKTLKLQHPSLHLLVLSMHDEAHYAERAVRSGARGYIMKHHAVSEVLAAVRQVLGGELYLSQKLSKRIVETAIKADRTRSESPVNSLSDRELEVFKLIGSGMGITEIAKKLKLSSKTVETYQARMKEKLAVKDSAQLFQHALKWIQANEG
jgi:DNA-binding NarL/FixJ family response regulator